MDSPAQFSGFGPAEDASLLLDQAPPSAASSTRYLHSAGDESDAEVTMRMDNLSVSGDAFQPRTIAAHDTDDTFAFKGSMGRSAPHNPSPQPDQAQPGLEPDPVQEDATARLMRLRAERDRLRKLNESVERSIEYFSGARGQLGRLQENIETTHGLMRVWSDLMSQTEHTRNLVMDPNWSMEGDLRALQAQQEAKERAAQEAKEAEQARLEALQRAKEEEEQQEEERKRKTAQAAEQAPKTRAVRGAVRGTRIRGTSRTVSASATSSTSGVSGIGRGGIPTSGISGSTRGSAPVTGVRGVRGLRSRAAPSGSGRGRGTT